MALTIYTPSCLLIMKCKNCKQSLNRNLLFETLQKMPSTLFSSLLSAKKFCLFFFGHQVRAPVKAPKKYWQNNLICQNYNKLISRGVFSLKSTVIPWNAAIKLFQHIWRTTNFRLIANYYKIKRYTKYKNVIKTNFSKLTVHCPFMKRGAFIFSVVCPFHISPLSVSHLLFTNALPIKRSLKTEHKKQWKSLAVIKCNFLNIRRIIEVFD